MFNMLNGEQWYKLKTNNGYLIVEIIGIQNRFNNGPLERSPSSLIVASQPINKSHFLKSEIVSSSCLTFRKCESVDGLHHSRRELFHSRGCQIVGRNPHMFRQLLNFNLRLPPAACQDAERKTFGQHLTAVLALRSACRVTFSSQIKYLWPVSPQNETEEQKTKEAKCVGSFIMRLSSRSIGALNDVVFTSVCGAEPAQVAKFNISNDVKHLLESSDYIFREFRIS